MVEFGVGLSLFKIYFYGKKTLRKNQDLPPEHTEKRRHRRINNIDTDFADFTDGKNSDLCPCILVNDGAKCVIMIL